MLKRTKQTTKLATKNGVVLSAAKEKRYLSV